MTARFVKVDHGTYAKIPNGTAGKITNSVTIMGLVQVDLVGYGLCNIWAKNLVKITKKEYFIGVLQGGK